MWLLQLLLPLVLLLHLRLPRLEAVLLLLLLLLHLPLKASTLAQHQLPPQLPLHLHQVFCMQKHTMNVTGAYLPFHSRLATNSIALPLGIAVKA